MELFEGIGIKVVFFFFCLCVWFFGGFGYLLLPEAFRQQLFIVLSQNWTTRTSKKAKKGHYFSFIQGVHPTGTVV